jgi:hypothetical protein
MSFMRLSFQGHRPPNYSRQPASKFTLCGWVFGLKAEIAGAAGAAAAVIFNEGTIGAPAAMTC